MVENMEVIDHDTPLDLNDQEPEVVQLEEEPQRDNYESSIEFKKDVENKLTKEELIQKKRQELQQLKSKFGKH